jgi:hypothetical protein
MIGGAPRIGWVLRYSYDWSDRKEGNPAPSIEKERPAVVVLSATRNIADEEMWLVRVAPITRRTPDDPSRAVEIPHPTIQRLGLDGARSWIILDHANEFIWPGPDVRPVPGREPTTIYYGALPPALFDKVRRMLLGLLKGRLVRGLLRSQ